MFTFVLSMQSAIYAPAKRGGEMASLSAVEQGIAGAPGDHFELALALVRVPEADKGE